MSEGFSIKCKKCGSENIEVDKNGDGYGITWLEITCLDCKNFDRSLYL